MQSKDSQEEQKKKKKTENIAKKAFDIVSFLFLFKQFTWIFNLLKLQKKKGEHDST